MMADTMMMTTHDDDDDDDDDDDMSRSPLPGLECMMVMMMQTWWRW
jgi:hypothetical protein